ncbi:SDR family NAD(P)-dependent oxidoreductase [Pelagibacterium sp.]|uniref:SDR family NAD(P)-dependent oxidoreductase n=1 Tax=Pelagibacterium sp. TaxID=1967288 RepID=UPI003A902403
MTAIYPDLKGKAVLVTGGASGIGEAIVRAFANQGARVGFFDIASDAGESLQAELTRAGQSVRFVKVDVTDIEALRGGIAELRSELGPLSILINNAARDDRHPALDVTPDDFDSLIAINFRHQFFVSQAVIDDMRQLGGGAIICMSSISWLAGFGGMPLYTAAKAGILGLVKSLARDFGVDNIRVNAISPGWIMTERQLDKWLTPEADAMREERQAIKRRLVPDDIARLALFLCSEDASAITGQNHIADGGWI